MQALVLVEELPLVDDQADVDLALGHGGEDLVERHQDDLDVLAQAKLEREVGGGQLAGDGDGLPLAWSRVIGSRAMSLGP